MTMRKVLLLSLALLLAADQTPAVTRSIITPHETGWLKLDWLNADVVACGAVTTCNIIVGTLPIRGRSMNAIVRVVGAAVGPTTVTVSVGRTTTAFIDYIVASNAKAAGVYGDTSGERGTNMGDAFFGDVPSLVATTDITLQFVSTGANLSTVTASTGTVWIRYEVIP